MRTFSLEKEELELDDCAGKVDAFSPNFCQISAKLLPDFRQTFARFSPRASLHALICCQQSSALMHSFGEQQKSLPENWLHERASCFLRRTRMRRFRTFCLFCTFSAAANWLATVELWPDTRGS